MMRDFSDPWEPEDIFDQAEARELRARIDARKAEHDAALKLEAKADAERQESARVFSMGANERLRLAEFAAHGVSPPVIDGVQTRTSFWLLLQLGWTVVDVFGEMQMVAPPTARERPRKAREDYGNDQGS